MKYCPSYRKYIVFKSGGNKWIVKRLRCKRKSCAYCSKVNRQLLVRRLEYAYHDMGREKVYFITLTLWGVVKKDDPQLWTKIRASFKKFVRAIRTIIKPEKIAYFQVYEMQKRGVPHIHLLLYTDINVIPDIKKRVLIKTLESGEKAMKTVYTSETIKKLAVSCGFGYQHDARLVSVAGSLNYEVVNYCAKYATKPDEAMIGVRAWATSRNFPTIPKEEGDEFFLTTLPVSQIRGALLLDTAIIDDDRHGIITLDTLQGMSSLLELDSYLDQAESEL